MAETNDSAATATHWLGSQATTPAGRAWAAVKDGDHKRLRLVLKTDSEQAVGKAQGPLGHPVTALTAAAATGDSLAIQILLKADANPDMEASGHMIQPPLAWAIEANSIACVRLLLDAGATRNPVGHDLVSLAVEEHNHITQPGSRLIELLLARGATATTTALHKAITKGYENAVKALVEADVDVNAGLTITGERPSSAALRLPVETGTRVLEMLVKAGADLNYLIGKNGQYKRPILIAAVEAGAAWAVPRLIEGGANKEAACEWLRKYDIRTTQERNSVAKAILKLTLPDRSKDS